MNIPRFFRQAAVATCGLLFAAVAAAHPDDDAEAAVEAAIFDCEHPPADALRKLPAPLDQWARIECTPGGQKLVATLGEWYWRYPASWTTRPEAPAWSPDASITQHGPKYFVSMNIDTLDAAAVAATHERLLRESPTYKFQIDEQPAAMYRVEARNNLGHAMDIFVPVVSEKRMWAILCVPVCRPEYAFMIERR